MQTELRPRHVAASAATVMDGQNMRLKQQALERSLLRMEAIVHPEVFGTSIPATTGNSTSTPKEQLSNLGADIRRRIKEMEALIPSERDPAKRELAKKRLENFAQRLDDLDSKGKGRGWKDHARNREELFSGLDGDPEAATAAISEAGKEAKSLKHSNAAVDQVLQVGMSILSNLGDQREGLKRATNRMEDMAGSLGLSNSLLRAVRRRQFGDAMIVYGGIFLVTLLLYLFYRWVHR